MGEKAGYICSSSSLLGFLGGSVGEELACNEGDLGLIPGLERSPEREWPPTPLFCPENFTGRGAWQATQFMGSQRVFISLGKGWPRGVLIHLYSR